MPSQKVTVTGSIDQKKILKTVRRTGRRAVLWPYPFNTQVQTQHLYQQHHPALAQTNNMGFNGNSSSSYNYHKHGYDDSRLHYGYNTGHSAVTGERTGDLFSEENPNACSIMWYLYCSNWSCISFLYVLPVDLDQWEALIFKFVSMLHIYFGMFILGEESVFLDMRSWHCIMKYFHVLVSN